MAGYHPMPALKAQGKVRHTLTSSERNMSVRGRFNTLLAASGLHPCCWALLLPLLLGKRRGSDSQS